MVQLRIGIRSGFEKLRNLRVRGILQGGSRSVPSPNAAYLYTGTFLITDYPQTYN